MNRTLKNRIVRLEKTLAGQINNQPISEKLWEPEEFGRLIEQLAEGHTDFLLKGESD